MNRRNKHRSLKFATISSILTKINRCFGLAGDISSFKRTFYSILYADSSGRGFRHGNKPSGAKFATIYSMLSKITRYFGTFWDFSTFKCTFYTILYADRNGGGFQLGNMPSCAKFVNIYSTLPIITRYFGTFWDISTFKRTLYSILDAECSAHYIQCGKSPADR